MELISSTKLLMELISSSQTSNGSFTETIAEKILSKNSVNRVKVNGKSFYLNQKYDEEVEVSHSPELLKHILGDEVPKRVLQT